jgi:hypothetical protein
MFEESLDLVWVLNVLDEFLFDEVVHRLKLVVKNKARRLVPSLDHASDE